MTRNPRAPRAKLWILSMSVDQPPLLQCTAVASHQRAAAWLTRFDGCALARAWSSGPSASRTTSCSRRLQHLALARGQWREGECDGDRTQPDGRGADK